MPTLHPNTHSGCFNWFPPCKTSTDQERNLLRGNNELQAAMLTYPQGMASVDPVFYNRPPVARGDMLGLQGVRAFSTDARTEAAAEQLNDELVRRQEKIFMEAGKNPREALFDAMRMPMSGPYSESSSVRANTLHSLARIAAKTDPLVSRTAIQEMRSLVDDMTLRSQAQFLVDLPDLYLQLGDWDKARETTNEIVVIAGKLYAQDSDLSDPNQAFKAMWPSTDLWRRSIVYASKLTPSPALDIIAAVPDAEIRSFARIVLANSLLGVQTPRLSILERHKNGGRTYIVP